MTTAPNNTFYAYTTGTKRYELTNHLGNVLAVVSDKRDASNQAEVISATDYYSIQTRLLDTRIAMWRGVDELYTKYPSLSSYNYCAGNPVKYVDLDGREIVIGTFIGRFFAELGVNNFEYKTIY